MHIVRPSPPAALTQAVSKAVKASPSRTGAESRLESRPLFVESRPWFVESRPWFVESRPWFLAAESREGMRGAHPPNRREAESNRGRDSEAGQVGTLPEHCALAASPSFSIPSLPPSLRPFLSLISMLCLSVSASRRATARRTAWTTTSTTSRLSRCVAGRRRARGGHCDGTRAPPIRPPIRPLMWRLI